MLIFNWEKGDLFQAFSISHSLVSIGMFEKVWLRKTNTMKLLMFSTFINTLSLWYLWRKYNGCLYIHRGLVFIYIPFLPTHLTSCALSRASSTLVSTATQQEEICRMEWCWGTLITLCAFQRFYADQILFCLIKLLWVAFLECIFLTIWFQLKPRGVSNFL